MIEQGRQWGFPPVEGRLARSPAGHHPVTVVLKGTSEAHGGPTRLRQMIEQGRQWGFPPVEGRLARCHDRQEKRRYGWKAN